MGNPLDSKVTPCSLQEGPGSAAYWEARYEHNDTPWDKGCPHPALQSWLGSQDLGNRGAAVVPGCGAGADVRALASVFPSVTGLDISESAVRRAGSFPRVGGETYCVADILSPPEYLVGSFDFVLEHTCFCALPPEQRRAYVAGVQSLLKADGVLLAIFYCDPDHEDSPPFGISPGEIDVLFPPAFVLMDSWVPTETFPGREGREQIRLYRKRSSC